MVIDHGQFQFTTEKLNSNGDTPPCIGSEDQNNTLAKSGELVIYDDRCNQQGGKRPFHMRHKGKEVVNNISVVNIKPMRLNIQEEAPAYFKLMESSAVFSFLTTKLFGATCLHEASQLRIHVILCSHNISAEPDLSSGFSFPLCGIDENAMEEVKLRSIEQQIVFFSKYLESVSLTEEIKRNGLGAISHYLQDKDNTGIRHVVLISPCSVPKECGYVYIFNEHLSEEVATTTGHYHWRFVRTKLFSSLRNTKSIE